MLRATAGAAIAVPMAALGSGPASGASAGSRSGGGDPGSPVEGPVMFCVHDAGRGEVSILHGTTEVVVTDRQLVARILTAAGTKA
jgi:hypothetical protein